MSWHDLSFEAMGSRVRLLIEDPLPGSPPAEVAAQEGMRLILGFGEALSRFRTQSELSALNRDRRSEVPASALLRRAVGAGLWAAERSGGLVDPTLLGAIERAGYVESRAGQTPPSLIEALGQAPARRPARPRSGAEWRLIEVDDGAGVIRRPPGVAFDTGGTGKGLAADLLAERLGGYSRFVVDCGGDVRIGGFAARLDPYPVNAQHPLDGEPAAVLHVGSGGIATSGLNIRLWRREDGSFAHHLLDPSSGEPVWSGLIGATALGRSALEAEIVSKAALLSGPDRGREILSPLGGMLVHEDGSTELVGPVEAKLVGRRSASASALGLAGAVRPAVEATLAASGRAG